MDSGKKSRHPVHAGSGCKRKQSSSCKYKTIFAILLLLLLVSEGKIVLLSVGSIIAGLFAWGNPNLANLIRKVEKNCLFNNFKFRFSLIALMIQFFEIANEVYTGDWAAIEDTIMALTAVVVLFVAVTMFLNLFIIKKSAQTVDAGNRKELWA